MKKKNENRKNKNKKNRQNKEASNVTAAITTEEVTIYVDITVSITYITIHRLSST